MEQVSTVRINRFTEQIKGKWDEYVRASQEGTFCNLSGWKYVLENTLGYQPHYLYAESEGKICGLLPMFFIKGLLTGKALISLPFGIYGGVCADNNHIAELLVQEAKRITQDLQADYLELRNITNSRFNMPVKDFYATFIKELPQNKEECLEDLPRKTRAAARKGIDFGLQVETGIDLLRQFYRVYSISVRNLGSPVFPYSFLENLVEEFKHSINVLLISYQRKPVASVFSFLYKDTVMPYYGGALPHYFRYQPNNFMYLKLMEFGVENGYKYFDFGRSKKDSGSYKFKQLLWS